MLNTQNIRHFLAHFFCDKAIDRLACHQKHPAKLFMSLTAGQILGSVHVCGSYFVIIIIILMLLLLFLLLNLHNLKCKQMINI